MNHFPWYATELFLLICEARGLSAASSHGKIRISQPALSAQMMQLEQHLGVPLFQRRPFRLTEQGKRFQHEALRLQANMNLLRKSITSTDRKPLRIAASDIIIRDYLPALLFHLEKSAHSQLILREEPSENLAGVVRDQEVDLAIGLLSRPNQNTAPLVEILAEVQLELLIPPSENQHIKQWSDLVKRLKSANVPRLVALPEQNLIMQHVQSGLKKSHLEWNTSIEVSSLSHVAKYVSLDFGFGFAIAQNRVDTESTKLQKIAIPPTFMPSLHLGVWHSEHLDATAQQMLAIIRRFARQETRKICSPG